MNQSTIFLISNLILRSFTQNTNNINNCNQIDENCDLIKSYCNEKSQNFFLNCISNEQSQVSDCKSEKINELTLCDSITSECNIRQDKCMRDSMQTQDYDQMQLRSTFDNYDDM